MSKNKSLGGIEYTMRKRTTKREAFLDIMAEIMPWVEWGAYVAPHYPKGKRGQ